MTLSKLLSICLIITLSACGAGDVESDRGTAASQAGDRVDACALVTQEDATELFGKPAEQDAGLSVPGMFGHCNWTWDTETSNQLLQFSIWRKEAYDAPTDAEALDLGDEGYVRTHPMAGVDIGWIQNGKTISLNYSTVGSEAPEATSKTEEMKALARQVAELL